jgi:hypothetical protein
MVHEKIWRQKSIYDVFPGNKEYLHLHLYYFKFVSCEPFANLAQKWKKLLLKLSLKVGCLFAKGELTILFKPTYISKG